MAFMINVFTGRHSENEPLCCAAVRVCVYMAIRPLLPLPQNSDNLSSCSPFYQRNYLYVHCKL